MLAWEMKLRVRRQSCEFKLAAYRQRHGEVVLERRRCPEKGPSWNKKSEKAAMLRMWIQRELAEIEHIKTMANCGPIVGNRMVLHVRDGLTHKVRPGPSIKDLIEREADRSSEGATEFLKGQTDGLRKALEILYNPYRFLDEDERAAYDKAEEAEDKIIERQAVRASSQDQQSSQASLAQAKAMASDTVVVRRRP